MIGKSLDIYGLKINLAGRFSSNNFYLTSSAPDLLQWSPPSSSAITPTKSIHSSPTMYGVSSAKNIYVDDCAGGGRNVQQAKTLKQNLKEAMKQGGFSLGKWQSNAPELVDDEEGDAIKAIADNAEPDVTKVLGVSWDSKNNNFVFQFDKEKVEKAV